MKYRSCLLPIIGLCLLLTACSREGTVYHHFAHPTCQPWSKCDTLYFTDTLYFEKEEAPAHLMLETILRHNDFYPYEDVYLKADITMGFTEAPIATADDSTALNNGQAITTSHSSQTFHLQLVNGKHHWSGKGWGSLRTVESSPYTISLPEKLYHRAETTGNDPSDTTRLRLPFHIAITSAMADESLKGIESAGIRLYH